MKKLACIFLVVLLLAGLAATVSAQSSATAAHSDITVESSGNCRVTLTMTLSLTQADPSLSYPLPAGATDITVNGAPVSLSTKNGVQYASLAGITGGGAGKYTITVSYLLSGVVTTEKSGMLLKLELLSGFTCPVEDYTFTIRLPGDIPGKPAFSSTYHETSITEHLEISTSGAVISGKATSVMKDHETLTMTLSVDESMFPRSAREARLLGLLDVAAYCLLALAAGYYWLLMRPHFRDPFVRTTAPDGITSGEVGLWLIGESVDFSLLVISWAQMGYLRIHMESNGHVKLLKRMDMGNERSAFENHYYRILFGRRDVVDGTSYHFARLSRNVSRQAGRLREVFAGHPVHRLIFRLICVLAAFLSGAMLGGGFGSHAIGLRIFIGIVTAVLAWLIQNGAGNLLLRQRIHFWLGLAAAAIWFILSLAAGSWVSAGFMIALQALAGLACAFGGRRTPAGQQTMSQLLDLWLHFHLSPRKNLLRLMKVNPGYYHNLAPYALAMNCDRRFARQYGRMHLPECAYLTDGRKRQLTATEWNELLRRTLKALDAKAKRLPYEQLFGK